MNHTKHQEFESWQQISPKMLVRDVFRSFLNASCDSSTFSTLVQSPIPFTVGSTLKATYSTVVGSEVSKKTNQQGKSAADKHEQTDQKKDNIERQFVEWAVAGATCGQRNWIQLNGNEEVLRRAEKRLLELAFLRHGKQNKTEPGYSTVRFDNIVSEEEVDTMIRIGDFPTLWLTNYKFTGQISMPGQEEFESWLDTDPTTLVVSFLSRHSTEPSLLTMNERQQSGPISYSIGNRPCSTKNTKTET